MDITELKEWRELKNHYETIQNKHMRDMFKEDPNRFDKFSVMACDLLLDYSKNRIEQRTIELLFNLAKASDLKEKIQAMFTGEHINNTEDRAVLHIALRNRGNERYFVDGEDVMPKVQSVLNRMRNFVNRIHNGDWRGYNGDLITDIVNIGIGGSDLGPAMVCDALKKYKFERITTHFVSNVDSSHIIETLKHLKPETTLFIISSKTFTTQETITNANTAKQWFLASDTVQEEDISKHFVAISTNSQSVKEFGIELENMFEFWDWVGGRYSLWSAIGLSIALSIGWDNFLSLLDGAYKMDKHFREEPFERNLPIIMALLELWYVNFFGANSYAIVPYDQNLEKFPIFLQQLEMESNGKQVSKEGKVLKLKTSPVIWGATGTNAQHSFFQLLHQGTHFIPIDFLAPLESHYDLLEHFDILMSNLFAQTEALMLGKSETEVREELLKSGLSPEKIEKLLPHKVFYGNKPTNTIIYRKLTPQTLGSLIALYEHKVLVLGALWDINSFDQWGVELGKQLAKKILTQLKAGEKVNNHDASTNGLINFFIENRKHKRT
mgnify:CR=1 FL=1